MFIPLIPVTKAIGAEGVRKAVRPLQQTPVKPDRKKGIVAVTIPVHNEVPGKYEEISIRQCLKVLRHYHIFIFARQGFDFAHYEDLCEGQQNVFFTTFAYAPGAQGFNDLMLTEDFYRFFLPYKFLLMHQTDAFVFRDSLYFWCSRGFDYIGASLFYKPIADTVIDSSRSLKLLYRTGLLKNRQNICGGLSLRRVKKFYLMSKYLKPKRSVTEDLFWAFTAPARIPWFRVPPLEKVMNFAYTDYPEEQYAMNQYVLPFACHAWYGHNFNFWEPIIRKHGYDW